MEKWYELRGFSQYEVSDHGNIRKSSNARVLRPKVNQYGVVGVGLMRTGLQCHRSVPLLVANTFIARPFPAFDTPINLNGNRMDNRPENLCWRPRWFAVQYNQQFKERYANGIEETVIELTGGREYAGSWECALTHGLLEREVVLSILNRTYTWPTYQTFGMVEL